jgi:integrase
MATEGSVYQRGKDGRWVAQYKDASGKVRYLYRKTKAEAKQALRKALTDRDNGIIPASKMTVGIYLDEWLEGIRGDVSRRTWVNQESIVRLHIKPTLEAKQLSRLEPKDVHKLYSQKMAEGLCSGTVGRIHALLNQAVRQAVHSKYIRTNPIAGVKSPKQQRREMEILTAEQVRHLLDVVRGDRFEVVYVLGATCGLRIGEVLSLRADDIDIGKGTLTVRRTLWRGQVYAPKTASSRRTLKLPQRALDSLERLRSTSDGQEYLFATRSGKPVAAHNFHKCSWKPLVAKAGLPQSLTFHKLRHGAASLLLNQNVPIPVVSRYLGHANPGVTMRVYAHMIDGTSGIAASGMDDALG